MKSSKQQPSRGLVALAKLNRKLDWIIDWIMNSKLVKDVLCCGFVAGVLFVLSMLAGSYTWDFFYDKTIPDREVLRYLGIGFVETLIYAGVVLAFFYGLYRFSIWFKPRYRAAQHAIRKEN